MGYNSIYDAALDNDHRAVKRLLHGGKADKDERNKNGWTPIIVAAGNGNEEIVQDLIKAKTNINAISDRHCTAVYQAALKRNWHILRVLVRHRAVTHIATEDHETALQYAVKSGKNAIVRLLLDNGAVNTINEQESCRGDTALHIAARRNLLWVVKMIITSSTTAGSMAGRIFTPDIYFDAVNADGEIAKYIAIRKNCTKIANEL